MELRLILRDGDRFRTHVVSVVGVESKPEVVGGEWISGADIYCGCDPSISQIKIDVCAKCRKERLPF
ncbi:MAG: hypothetical protein KAT70_08760 [Thermoplasmata archaeon]|nr:hypothetical protein [Thermoplasmata archaeon]